MSPMVSVTIVTYNHGVWLRECLDSVVSQSVDFEFEVIVGDDASTDEETVSILKEFSALYPQLIRPIFREKNVGPISNFLGVVNAARGKYIAHLDGDDFMLPHKLQRQVDYLEAHPGISIAAHRMNLLRLDGVLIEPGNDDAPEVGSVHDLLRLGCYFCHSSKMYRKASILTISADRPVVDYYFHIEQAMSGGIFFSKDVLGCHRYNSSGISKDGTYKKYIYDAYEASYDRALELGLPFCEVQRGRIRHRQAIALSALAVGNLAVFRSLASIDSAYICYASPRQLFIHVMSCMPKAARLIWLLRSVV